MEATEVLKQLQLLPLIDTNNNFPDIFFKKCPVFGGTFFCSTHIEEQIIQRTYKQAILK